VIRPPWLDELEGGIAQRASIPDAHGDFGGAAVGAPCSWTVTASASELQHALDVARRHHVPIALRGSGHSSGGQSSAPAGIMLEHRPPDEGLELSDGLASVPAHWTWGRVERELQRAGRDLRVTTSSVETTVAGTLSVGGIGPRSLRHGPQVDQVSELCLLAANGARIRCSERESPDVFHSALTGLGRAGIIERVTLRTAPHLPYLCAVSTEHASFTELAERVRPFAALEASVPDDFRVLVKRGTIECFCATRHATREAAERAARGPVEEWSRSGARRVIDAHEFELCERTMPLDAWRGCRHLWSDYCFAPDAFLRFAEYVDAELTDSLTQHLAYVLCIAPRAGEPFALDLRPRSRQRCFSVGLFYSVPSHDLEAVERARRAHAHALSECLSLGGRPYLYGLWGGRDGLSSGELTQIFGAGYARSRAVRERLDPGGILNPYALN
jgi:FAD/FMN-containing dehydrogenase